jgi:Tol biopolymer transport system component
MKLESKPSTRPFFTWSPEEDKIAVLEPAKIFVRDMDKKVNFSIPVDHTTIEELAWSLDGEKIAFVRDNRDILILDIEKREFNKIFSAKRVGTYSARWSPDSKKLIFYEMKGSGDKVSYDVYVMGGSVKKLITLGMGSRVEQWYPDSERILIKIRTDDSCALHSLSTTGVMKKLIETDGNIDGMVSPSGFISAISPNPGSKIPPYAKTYDLFLLNDSDKLTIENVTYYMWRDTDVLFVKDNKISILNVTTQDIWDVSVPAKNFTKISWDPSGRFIVVKGYIIELHTYSNHIRMDAGNNINSTVYEVMTIKNPMDEQSGTTTAKEPSGSPGFTAIIVFMGILIAMGYMQMKN